MGGQSAGLGLPQLIVLALLATTSISCYVVPLVINRAWWCLMGLLPLIFLPVPWFFVPARDSFAGAAASTEGDTARHWAEFTTGLTSCGVFAIPVIIWHVGMLTVVDLVFSCAGAAVLLIGSTAFLFWVQKDHESSGFF